MSAQSTFETAAGHPSPPAGGARASVASAATVITMLVVAFALYWISYPRPLNEDPHLSGARSNLAFQLPKRWAEGHGFGIPMRHYDEVRPDVALALTPRDAAALNGQVVPKDFAGTMLINGIALKIWRPLFLAIGPLFSVLTALAVVALARELVPLPDRSVPFLVAPLAALLWLTHPATILFGSYLAGSDLPAAFAMTTGFVFFVRFWRTRGTKDLVLMSAFFGTTIVMRYPNVIVPAVIGALLLFTRRLGVKGTLLSLAVYAPFLGVILLFDWQVYGAPLTTGYHLGAELLRETANLAEESFFKFRPLVVGNHLRFYLIENPIFLGPPLVGAGYGIWCAVHDRENRPILIAVTATTLGLTLYYLGQDVVGSSSAVVRSSLLRYMLPVIAVWFALLVRMLMGRPSRRALGAGAVVAVAVAGSWVAYNATDGIGDRDYIISSSRTLREAIIDKTPRDALIVVRAADKYVFPGRQSMTLTYVNDNPEPVYKGELSTWQMLPPAERLADVLSDPVGKGIPTYILVDFRREIFRGYRDALAREDIVLDRVAGVVPPLYRLEPAEA